VCACVCVCMRVCVCTCMRVCVCVCVLCNFKFHEQLLKDGKGSRPAQVVLLSP
jgi:hypothetical protein